MKEDQEIMLPIYREHSTTLKNKKEKKDIKLPKKNEEHTINNSHLPCINSSVN